MSSRALFVTSDADACRQAADLLADRGCEVVGVTDPAGDVDPAGFDVILLDTRLAGIDAATWLARFTRKHPVRPPVILVADRDAAEIAVAVMQRGADDACFRPLCPVGLPARIEGLVARHRLSRIDETVKTLEFRNQELESFIYIVTHDMKTPVVNLQGLVSLIEQDHAAELPEPVKDFLRRARRNAERLEELLRDLLEYPRRLRLVGPLEAQDTGRIVARAVDGLRELARAKGVEIVLAPDLPVARCDAKRLQQVFHNLVENAIKHSVGVEKPKVEVGWTRLSEGPRFEIRDNGPGIEAEHLRDIFKLFHRIPGTPVDGSGIGLAVARQLVEAHGGDIWCESKPGQGTTFAFTLAG
jgi:signal transduction histidine kinase